MRRQRPATPRKAKALDKPSIPFRRRGLVVPDAIGVNVGEVPGKPSKIVLRMVVDEVELLVVLSPKIALQLAGNILDAGWAVDGYNGLLKSPKEKVDVQ